MKRDVFDSTQYLFPEQSKISLNIDLNLTQGTVLAPLAPAFLVDGEVLGATSGIIEPEENKEIFAYIVEEDDTLTSVAEKFNVSLDTLLWANNLTSKSVITLGQEILVLPVSGMMHIVRQRDTLSEIAELYKTKVSEIVEFNDLKDEGKIFAGDMLIVPNAVKPKNIGNYVQVPLSQSYFICPVPSPCRQLR